ncbi:MAG: hypothetical protein WEA76_08350 [Acidimicrobiia bacterium]
MAAMVLTTFSSRMEADVAVAKLASNGIAAWIQTDSANGFEPQWDFIRGVKVLTQEADMPEAADVLGVDPPPPIAPMSDEREQVVRVVRNGIFLTAAGGVVLALWQAFG